MEAHVLRRSSFDFISDNQILFFIVQMFESTSGDARSDHLSRHA